MSLTQDTTLHFILSVVVIALLIAISMKGQGSASEINDQVKSEFDKDKLKVNLHYVSPDIKGICFDTNPGELIITENEPLFTDYNEFVKEQEFVLTINVMDQYQLSGIGRIKCESTAGSGRCSNFLDHDPVRFVLSEYDLIWDKGYAEISAWKSAGIDENQAFRVGIDTLIRQKADYYMTTFRIYRC